MWQMVASQVVISAKKAGKGDNLWWPQSKDEEYRGCNRWNGYVLAGADGLTGGDVQRKGAMPMVAALVSTRGVSMWGS